MSFETGKFINKHLKGKSVSMYIGDQAESLSYSDTETSSYAILVGTAHDYDDESGIITFVTEQGKKFYVAEVKIEVFWETESDFNILEITKSTVRGGKDWMKQENKNRDIM
jgi:hypothetical protein